MGRERLRVDERSEPALLATVTSTTLLEGLRDPANEAVWEQWVARYRPLVVRTASRVGVPEVDAEDVAQNALLAFALAYREGRYERTRGRLRAWLFGIVSNQVLRWRERRARVGAREEETLGELTAPDELEALWNEEWRAAVLRQCFAALRPEFQETTLEAFERFVLRGEPARDVARGLGLTENAVFGAKRRVLRRLRQIEPMMDEIF
jgi:RNA polymerase sigma-70 factor (ECF subfamily)